MLYNVQINVFYLKKLKYYTKLLINVIKAIKSKE